jgi:DNA-binding CsgD family transcriptional regulator
MKPRPAPATASPLGDRPTPGHDPKICLPLGGELALALAKVVHGIGSSGFHQDMLDFLGLVCTVDSGGAMIFHRDRSPRRLVHRFHLEERSLPEDSYLLGPYALDPLYHMFLQGAPEGAYWLKEHAPDDFFESEYYHQFYSRIGLSDEIDVLWRMDEDTALLYFLERSARNPTFQAADLAALELVLPIVFAASARHHQALVPRAAQDAGDLVHRKVQSTIENFAGSLLTQREREVLFYMLRGYSSGMTAQRLATSEGTIKVHRKNIHRKLDIGSQAELFSLFINCIPFASPDQQTDPLEVYQRKPRRPPLTGPSGRD